MYFLYGHTGKLDEEMVYFLTAKDIQDYCEVDYDEKTINVNLFYVDTICLFKEPGKSKLQDTLDIIAEQIDKAEVLDTSIISEQLKISTNEKHLEYNGVLYDKFDETLPENIELMFQDFNNIKEMSVALLKEIEPLVTMLRQLALETSTVSLSEYFLGINQELSKLDEWEDKFNEESQYGLLALIIHFYQDYHGILLDRV